MADPSPILPPAPTGDLVCRLLQAVTGHRPCEIEFAARAETRATWLIRSWFDDGSRRDHCLHLLDVAEDQLPGHLTESRFELWPPLEIRGAIRRCRC